MTAELVQVGGTVAAAGLALLAIAPHPRLRLAGLAAAGLGLVPLVLYLVPDGSERLLAAAAVAGVALGAPLAYVFQRWPWALAAAALACAPIRIPVELSEAEEANLLLPLYGVILGAGLARGWQLLRARQGRRELGVVAWPLAAFVAWAGASMWWTGDVRQGAIQLLFFFIPFGVLAVALARLPWRTEWVGRLWALLIALGGVFAAIGIFQWLTRDVFWNPKVIVGNAYAPFYRVNSVFWDPSIYGRFLVIAILAGVIVVVYGATARYALPAAALIVLLWVGLLFSFSQSSFASLMVGVALAAAFAWRWRAAVAVGAAAGVLLLVGASASPIRHTLIEHSRDGLNRATSGRADLVTEGSRIALDHPVAGVGLGGFRKSYAERTGLRGREPKRAASHNTPVTVAAETGLPGLLLFLWLLGSALFIAVRRVRTTFAARTALFAGFSLAAIAVHSLFYDAFFEDPMTWGLLAFAALGSAALDREEVIA